MEIYSPRNLFSVTEVELIYRNKVKVEDRPKIKKSSEAYDILLSAWDMNKIELVEHFLIMLLDRGNACLGISHVSSGSISECIVDPKIVFSTALKAKASAIIMAHNHPSGNVTPSQADIALTHKLFQAGDLLDITIMDHLIVTPTNFFSMGDEGLMPK